MKHSLALLCAVGLMGLAGDIRPALAQRIVDVTPSVNSQEVSADALVSGVFDTSSGSVDVNSVRIFVDGRDVTNDSAITPNFFSYRPAQPLSPGQHQIQVEYSNTQGQRRVASWNFTVESPQAALTINSVTHNATEPLDPSSTLLATVNGTPGVQASVLLIENGTTVREVQAQEVSAGVYVASYSLTASNVSAETIAIGQLRRGDQKIFAAAAQPIIIAASAPTDDVVDTAVDGAPNTATPTTEIPLQPQITSHSDGDEVSGGFELVGQTQPNASVDIVVSSRTPVAGGFISLGSNDLVDTTVTADANGIFRVRVPAPLAVNSDTRYDIEASARTADQTSPVTRLTLQQD